ncbi:MAG: hypothetical protein R3D33_01380 [Hyphomicrobiaceae bacterium]
MKPRLLFVTNQRKTAFYSALGKRLAGEGAEVHWVSVGERWSQMLAADGWQDGRILHLHRHGWEWEAGMGGTPLDLQRLRRIETASGTSMKSILIMDRELNRRQGPQKDAYVSIVAREIDRFVAAHGIDYGFGEPTWAPEMIASAVLQASGGHYWSPFTIRVPSSRIAFFPTLQHDRVSEIREPGAADREIARATIRSVRERGERPYYFTTNRNPQRFRTHWLEEARKGMTRAGDDRFDHTVPGLVVRSRRRIGARLHAVRARSYPRFERAPANPTRPFVFVTLHKQPESSVDVFGAPFDNQLEAIRALARVLPFDWEIWVKEHNHAIGDRSLGYYEALLRIPGVRLIDPDEDGMAIMRRASLVASASGTSCMEAGILGIPAVTFGRLFFAPLLLRTAFDPYAMTSAAMADLIAEADAMRKDPARDQRIEDFLAWLVAQSSEGLISDPVSNPSCLDEANIAAVGEAMMRVMRSHAPAGTAERLAS